MANVTLDGNPAANLPLTGTEVIALIQTGTDKSTPVSNLSTLAPVQSVAGRTGAITLSSTDITNFNAASDARITNAVLTKVVQQYNANLEGFSNLDNLLTGPVVQTGISGGIPNYRTPVGVSSSATTYNNLTNSVGWGDVINLTSTSAKTFTLDVTGLGVNFCFYVLNSGSGTLTFTPAGANTIYGLNNITGGTTLANTPLLKCSIVLVNTTPVWFVEQSFVPSTLPAAPVLSVAGKTGVVTLVSTDITDFNTASDARITNAISTNVIQQYNANLQGLSGLSNLLTGPLIQTGVSGGVTTYHLPVGSTFSGTSFDNVSNAALWGDYVNFTSSSAKTVTLNATGLGVNYCFYIMNSGSGAITFSSINPIYGLTSATGGTTNTNTPLIKCTIVLANSSLAWYVEEAYASNIMQTTAINYAQIVNNGTFGHTVAITGDIASVDGSSHQYALNLTGSYSPTAGSTESTCIGAQPVFQIPTGQTTTAASCYHADPQYNASNHGTITTAYGFWFSGGSTLGGGTVTLQYGGYFAAPLAGTTKVPLYADGIAIGTQGVAPPNKGILVNQINLHQPSGFTGGDAVQLTSGVQTTNATPTGISEVVVNENELITMEGIIGGKYSDNTGWVSGKFFACAKRVVEGNTVLVGTPVLIINQDSTTATFTCDAFVTNESLRILVTGVAATTINWTTTFTYQKTLLNT